MRKVNKPKFWEADEARQIAEADVISVWHPHLEDYELCYVFKEDLTKANRVALATIKKTTPFEYYLSGVDLVVTINADYWPELTYRQRVALLDHEFCHTFEVTNDKGVSSLKFRGHDLEEFTDVVRRHGAWMPDIKDITEAQREFDFNMVKREGERVKDAKAQDKGE